MEVTAYDVKKILVSKPSEILAVMQAIVDQAIAEDRSSRSDAGSPPTVGKGYAADQLQPTGYSGTRSPTLREKAEQLILQLSRDGTCVCEQHGRMIEFLIDEIDRLDASNHAPWWTTAN